MKVPPTAAVVVITSVGHKQVSYALTSVRVRANQIAIKPVDIFFIRKGKCYVIRKLPHFAYYKFYSNI